MHADWLFVSTGVLALCVAIACVIRVRKRTGMAAEPLLWALASAGFLLQGFSPHLTTRPGGFAISASSLTVGPAPAELIARQRWMQSLSGLLLLSACIGLAICYRHYFHPAGPEPARPLSRD